MDLVDCGSGSGCFFFLSLKKLIRNFELTLKKLIQTNQIQVLEHIG